MVTRLTETEMKQYLDETFNPNKERYLMLNIPHEHIQSWIDDGQFAFIKKELTQYYNLKFGCLKNETSCQYLFVVNPDAIIRLRNFFDSLIVEERQPIYKLSSSKRINNFHRSVPLTGSYNACPLF
jgi:hypothetical protein